VLDFPKLSKKQLDKLSDIFSDVGLVSLAALALPALFDSWNPLRVVLGLAATLICWFISLFLRR
jgi:hypothetical protein